MKSKFIGNALNSLSEKLYFCLNPPIPSINAGFPPISSKAVIKGEGLSIETLLGTPSLINIRSENAPLILLLLANVLMAFLYPV